MPVSASMVSANVFIDDFNRADGAIGSNYDAVNGGLAVFSNAVRGTTADVRSYSIVKTSVALFSANQRASIRYTALNVVDRAGPVVRFNTDTQSGYRINTDGNSYNFLQRVTGSTATNIGSVPCTLNAGDVVELRAVGSNISWYKNGVLQETVVNSTYSTGQPGLIYDWQNTRTTRLDNFIASDIPTTNAQSLCIMSQTQIGNLIVGSQ